MSDTPQTTDREAAIQSLLEAWIHARVSLIWETSGAISDDTASLVQQAKERAAAVGVPWDDMLLPEHARPDPDAEA